MNPRWSVAAVGDVLRYRKQFITIDDTKTYRRPRVRLHAEGIVLRDVVDGASIKTKSQQVCRGGDFLVAEIDAKVGGFGIVPSELAGAIVSSHYFLFEADDTKLDRRFLDWFIRTPAFRQQVEAQGSTNYAAIRPADVLHYCVPLPPLAEQRRIVSRIDELKDQLNQTTTIRREVATSCNALILSTHFALAGGKMKSVGEVLELHEDVQPVRVGENYPQVGIKSFGSGLFKKGAVSGSETTYRGFNRLYEGALVLSQVKGWEGALGVCPLDMQGWFVSPEYRTFRCIAGKACPGYLAPLVRTEWFWTKLAEATRGVGARRERTRPEAFLKIEIAMPEYQKQEQGERLFREVERVTHLHAACEPALDALMPAILDRAFRGEL